MTDLQRPPERQDFGLSEDAVARLPTPFVASHSSRILAVGFGLTVAVSVACGVALSGSMVAAVVFGVLLVCAGSIVLLPVAVAAVCAAEAVEHRWLCRRIETYRRWRAYQAALATHEEAVRRHRVRELDKRRRWCSLPGEALREAVVDLLQRQGWRVERVAPEPDTGVDLRMERDGRSAVVRCVPGGLPCGPALVRELVTCRDDFGTDGALLVAPGGGSRQLERYAQDMQRRAVVVIDADSLVAADERAGSLWE